jgi:hypothetical protein
MNLGCSVRPTLAIDQCKYYRCGEDDRQEPLERCCDAAKRCALRDFPPCAVIATSSQCKKRASGASVTAMLQGGARRAFVAAGFVFMSAVVNFLSTLNPPASGESGTLATNIACCRKHRHYWRWSNKGSGVAGPALTKRRQLFAPGLISVMAPLRHANWLRNCPLFG